MQQEAQAIDLDPGRGPTDQRPTGPVRAEPPTATATGGGVWTATGEPSAAQRDALREKDGGGGARKGGGCRQGGGADPSVPETDRNARSRLTSRCAPIPVLERNAVRASNSRSREHHMGANDMTDKPTTETEASGVNDGSEAQRRTGPIELTEGEANELRATVRATLGAGFTPARYSYDC